VTRAIPPDSYYPTPPKSTSTATPRLSFVERIKTAFFSCITTLSRRVLGGLDWWRPIRISCWLRYDKNYGGTNLFFLKVVTHNLSTASLFRTLRFIPAGHGVPPLEPPKPTLRSQSPYHIFYNVYKPSTPFKKSSPPPPDFQLVVVK
jgi:tRNA-splicing endonuclease subunit Sen54